MPSVVARFKAHQVLHEPPLVMPIVMTHGFGNVGLSIFLSSCAVPCKSFYLFDQAFTDCLCAFLAWLDTALLADEQSISFMG
jgi:hypothetical protein